MLLLQGKGAVSIAVNDGLQSAKECPMKRLFAQISVLFDIENCISGFPGHTQASFRRR